MSTESGGAWLVEHGGHAHGRLADFDHDGYQCHNHTPRRDASLAVGHQHSNHSHQGQENENAVQHISHIEVTAHLASPGLALRMLQSFQYVSIFRIHACDI